MSKLTFYETDQPIPEDVIFNELRRIQDMILSANISDRTRYMMTSVIDAAFVMFECDKPGYQRPRYDLIGDKSIN